MQTTTVGLAPVKEFARRAGVTVRTLHLYDRLGLLKPAALTDSGYRLYGEAELERLEHILALRFVGFNLDQIKELLQGSPQPLVAALRMQRDVIARQKRRLESALAAIDEAEHALAREESVDRLGRRSAPSWRYSKCRTIGSGRKNYYSEEAREKFEERRRDVPRDVVEQGQNATGAR